MEDLNIIKKAGRPRNPDIVTEEGENRKHKVNTIYLKNRYNSDPEFREKCKEKRRQYYMKKKNT